jgi:hypothetical protein
MPRFAVKARVLTGNRGDPLFWETPVHSVEGTATVAEVTAQFRTLYRVDHVIGFTFLNPELFATAPPILE